MPRTSTERIPRTCSRASSGDASITRSMAVAAEFVWSVPNTRTPVSAAESASWMVSRSRISPTTSTSGDSRSAERSADANDSACTPTCRCVTRLRAGSCRNSTGSSIVMMCRACLRFTSETMAASVVVLPAPVGPVTSTRPLLCSVSLATAGGSCRSSSVGIRCGMTRNTAPIPRACWK